MRWWLLRVLVPLLDGGAPFGARTSVRDDRSTVEPAELQGYGIVEAESLEAATALAEGHPFLSEGQGRFHLDIFELVDIEM